MPHPREVAAKPLPPAPRVHHGHFYPLCGSKKRGVLMAEKWAVVDCQNCIRVQRARHDKPSR